MTFRLNDLCEKFDAKGWLGFFVEHVPDKADEEARFAHPGVPDNHDFEGVIELATQHAMALFGCVRAIAAEIVTNSNFNARRFGF
jgi:hypothetical protein